MAGHRYEDACAVSGISRDTFYEWRVKGKERPESRHGQFLRAVEAAVTASRVKMVKKLLDDPDWKATWKIMVNRWPDIFKETYLVRQEMSGPGGQPLPPAVNPFMVEIVIHGELPQHPKEELPPTKPANAIVIGNGETQNAGNGDGNGSGGH